MLTCGIALSDLVLYTGQVRARVKATEIVPHTCAADPQLGQGGPQEQVLRGQLHVDCEEDGQDQHSRTDSKAEDVMKYS